MRRSIVLLLWLDSWLTGCVNEYVVHDDAGTSDGGGTGGSTNSGIPDPDGSGGDASQSGSGESTAQTGDTTPDTAPADGSEGTSAGEGGGETEPGTTTVGNESGTAGFGCEPCTADAECGDAFDNCVELGDAGLRCVIACPEGGCERGFDCAETVSVDGVVQAQCVPLVPNCE